MHNYQKKIEKLLSEGKLPAEKGKVYDYKVAHDEWCNVYRGGECNCDPDITAVEITEENLDEVSKRRVEDAARFRKDIKDKIV